MYGQLQTITLDQSTRVLAVKHWRAAMKLKTGIHKRLALVHHMSAQARRLTARQKVRVTGK